MSKKILVAGGAGFIGSHLCEWLLDKGDQVTAIDSLVTGSKKNLEHLFSKGLKFIKQDVIKPFFLNEKFDQIYNLASPASPKSFDKMSLYILRAGSIGHENLLIKSKEWGARILFASTSEIYGDPLVHPQKETYFGNVNSIGSRSCYNEAKRYSEALTVCYSQDFGVETRIARIFNTYGPRMDLQDGRILPNFFSQALNLQPLTIYGNGYQTRSYCYVMDIVKGLHLLMNSNESRPVNLGNSLEKTVLEIADLVSKLTRNNQPYLFLPLPEDDPKQRCPDITRAKEVLGWEPKVELNAGLKKMHASYLRGGSPIRL